MSRWMVVLTLSLVSATAQGQSGQPASPIAVAPSPASAATDRAGAATFVAERRVAQLTVRSTALEKRYTDELDAIDRLKRQRPSWRRDREIRDSLSASLETSNQLDAATAEVKKAKTRLDSARRAYLEAIDAELGAGPPPGRVQKLERARVLLAWQLKDAGAPRHILIPDLEIDPLADPEELDQRAAELRESEQLLSRQLTTLDAQVSELQHTAQLRKHNDRAADLVSRYEDSPSRRGARGTENSTDIIDNPAPTHLPTSLEATTKIDAPLPAAVNDMIDGSTDGITGSRSASPAQRAEAARKAHDALARWLEQVRSKRIEVERRAKLLRAKR